jgi:hypothetical protein
MTSANAYLPRKLGNQLTDIERGGMCVEGSGGYKSDETIKLFLAQ